MLGVAGLQGHGQRELFLGLFGMMRASGIIEIGGKRTSIRSPRQALSAGIGMALLPEDRRNEGLLLTKSVRENLILCNLPEIVTWGFLNLGLEASLVAGAIERLASKSARRTGIWYLVRRQSAEVVFAKLLMTEARILLLYDPTRGVDVGTKAEIFRLMRDLARQGYAILFYSTDLPELVHLADRVMVLSFGRIAEILRGGEADEKRILRATCLGWAERLIPDPTVVLVKTRSGAAFARSRWHSRRPRRHARRHSARRVHH